MDRDLALLNKLWDEVLAAQQVAPETEWHTKAAIDCLEMWLPKIEATLRPNQLCFGGDRWWVLDVGCGTGFLSNHFTGHDWAYSGIALQEPDPMGMPWSVTDYHFCDFDGKHADLVFCRHVIEHSPMPLLALSKLHEFTTPGGWCIVITPLPPCNVDYPDHYSVMGRGAWSSLFRRVGFKQVDYVEAMVGDGSVEMRFLLRKVATP